MTTLIIILLAILAYTWIVYPGIVLLAARFRKEQPRAPVALSPAALPEVTVLVAAHNEEGHIAERIRNLLESDYPAERLFVRVGVDGSTDRTGAYARDAASGHANVAVTVFPQRRGKVAVLKDLVSQSSTLILVFTDANTLFRADTVRQLVRGFEDPAVGCVCGRLVFAAHGAWGMEHGVEGRPPALPSPSEKPRQSGSSAIHGEFGKETLESQASSSSDAMRRALCALQDSPEGVYWRMETMLKAAESRLDSCLGANGAVYALRRECFWLEIPENTIVDDFVLAMKVRENGRKVVFVNDALAYEDLPETSHEWKRRVRIGAGDFQALQICRSCLSPRYGLFAWMLWSHKLLRWFTPFVLLAVVLVAGWDVACGFLCGRQLPVLSAVVLALAGLCLLAAVVPGASLVRHFAVMQAALLAGFLRFCRGGLEGYWERTPRQGMRAETRNLK